MSFTSHQDHLRTVFGHTIQWFTEKLNQLESKILRSFINIHLDDLREVQQNLNEYFEKLSRETVQRARAEQKEIQNIIALQNLLTVFENNVPGADHPHAAIHEHQEKIAQHRAWIEASQKSHESLRNLWSNQDRRARENAQALADYAELSIALNLTRVDFERLANSAKTIVFSIPNNIPGFSLITAAIDVTTEFYKPLQDMGNTDKVLVWLENRQAALDDLKKGYHYLSF